MGCLVPSMKVVEFVDCYAVQGFLLLGRSSSRRLTQSDLSKGDRTRVMVCITMDAHGRDVVQKMSREGVTKVSEFMVVAKHICQQCH